MKMVKKLVKKFAKKLILFTAVIGGVIYIEIGINTFIDDLYASGAMDGVIKTEFPLNLIYEDGYAYPLFDIAVKRVVLWPFVREKVYRELNPFLDLREKTKKTSLFSP